MLVIYATLKNQTNKKKNSQNEITRNLYKTKEKNKLIKFYKFSQDKIAQSLQLIKKIIY